VTVLGNKMNLEEEKEFRNKLKSGFDSKIKNADDFIKIKTIRVALIHTDGNSINILNGLNIIEVIASRFGNENNYKRNDRPNMKNLDRRNQNHNRDGHRREYAGDLREDRNNRPKPRGPWQHRDNQEM